MQCVIQSEIYKDYTKARLWIPLGNVPGFNSPD